MLEQDGKTLLLKRTKLKGGNYGLAGGHVDPGETPSAAVIRELKEEIGVKIKAKHLRLHKTIYREKGDLQNLHLIFQAKKWKGEPQNLEPRLCKHIGWYELAALPKNLSPTTKATFQKDALYVE